MLNVWSALVITGIIISITAILPGRVADYTNDEHKADTYGRIAYIQFFLGVLIIIAGVWVSVTGV